MTIKAFVLVGLAATLGGGGCSRPGGDKEEGDRPAPADGHHESSADAAVRPPPGGHVDGADPAKDDGGDGFAMILETRREVFLKRKNASDFVRILREVGFHSGDILRVGERARALVYCRDLCVLEVGEYRDCCTPECKKIISLNPDEPGARTAFVPRSELPPAQARALAESEAQIASLRLDATAAQLLRANLYVNWKVSEAAPEVQRLSDELDRPGARKKLRDAYAPIMRRTGDLFQKVNLRQKAIDRYKKATGLAPERNGPDKTGSAEALTREKARAHTSLADVYVEAGNKPAAIESLSRAKELYRLQGDIQMAKEADLKISEIRAR